MRKEISPHISALVDSFVPEHLRANYPLLIEFAKAYFDFLEDSHKSSYYQNTISEQGDVWQQEQQFLARIQKEIGLYVPREFAVTPKVFYQKVVDLYKSKGSEAAIITFFQLFLDDVAEIYYPWEQVLIPSDGRWIVEDKLRVSMITGDPDDFAGQIIKQVDSDATAKVDKVERRVYSDGIIYELTLVKGTLSGTFEAGETITAVGGLSAEIYRSVSGFNIVSGGSNYKPGDRIRVSGFEGFSFNAFVSFVDPNGAITDIRISNYGAGNTPQHVKDDNVSEIFYFQDFALYNYSDDNPAQPVLTEAGAQAVLSANVGIEPFASMFNVEIDDGEGGTRKLGDINGNGTINAVDALIALRDSQFIDIEQNEREWIVQRMIPYMRSYIANPDSDNFDYEGFFEPRVNVVVESTEGTGAKLNLQFDTVVTTAGEYRGVKGQLSESIVLQDSNFYQKFSYEVSTNYSTNVWLDGLKRTVHPAGMAVFGNIRLNEFVDNSIQSNVIYTATTSPSEYEILERPLLISTPLGFRQDYTIQTEVYFSEAYVGTEDFNQSYTDVTETRSQGITDEVFVTQD